MRVPRRTLSPACLTCCEARTGKKDSETEGGQVQKGETEGGKKERERRGKKEWN